MSSPSSVLRFENPSPLSPRGGRGDLLRTEYSELRTRQEDEAFERISRGFREYTEGDKGPAFAMLAVLALVLIGLTAVSLLRRDRGGSRRLFRRLADANGLTTQERRLLQAVAVRAGEDHLPSLFFRRRMFDEATADMTADPDLLESVRRKVYDP